MEETLNELLNKEAEELTSAAKYERTEAHQGHRSLDYTLGILRQWEKSGVHTISEITALEPESRTAAVAVGQTEAQPTDSGTLADWEQAWLAQKEEIRRRMKEAEANGL